MDPEWLTLKEGAEVARCSTVTLAREIRAGRLRAYKLARRRVWRLRRDDIDRGLSGGSDEPRPYAPPDRGDDRF
jgi:excisionase family DNA binding protein